MQAYVVLYPSSPFSTQESGKKILVVSIVKKIHVESLLLENPLKQPICLAGNSPILARTFPIFNRKYIFINGGFSIAILVFTEVHESTKS